MFPSSLQQLLPILVHHASPKIACFASPRKPLRIYLWFVIQINFKYRLNSSYNNMQWKCNEKMDGERTDKHDMT